MNHFLFCLLLALPLCGQSQLTLRNNPKLPDYLSVKGTVKELLQWTDSEGEHLLVTTESGPIAGVDEYDNPAESGFLYAYHFLQQDGTFQQTWRVYDFVNPCPVDMEANFVKGTLQVTDLDKDNIGEVWMMYTTVCHGDVSPSNMKIILYEGSQKYAMRGDTRVQIGETDFIGGNYTFDKAFKEAPEAFRTFAKSLWKKHIRGQY